MGKISKKILLIFSAILTILLLISFFLVSKPKSIQEIPSKIKESVENIGKGLSESVSSFFKPENKTANETYKNETENKTQEIPSLNQQTIVSQTNPSMKLEIGDIFCNHYFRIFVKNVGDLGLNFSNSEFYYKDKGYKLDVNLSFDHLEPQEEGEIFISLSEGIPLPQKEPWHIEMILKDEKNYTFFDASFLVFCIL